jgi:hemoglobin-like flavoprotein
MDVKLVSATFDQVWLHAIEFAEEFYTRLFAENPELEPLFEPSRMVRQYREMIYALDLVIGQAESGQVDEAIDDISVYLQSMGARHARYGVIAEHFPKVGAALTATFAAHVGESWTPAHEESWNELYTKVADVLMAGMSEVVEAERPDTLSHR